ncbi:hypothetical protein A3781_19955 [Bacillus badius]|nr:hypothetical protein A3781_19955 [Bacillus badius]
MLTMSDIKCIKLLRNQKGLSISKIAETLHKLFFEKFVPRFTYKEKGINNKVQTAFVSNPLLKYNIIFK